MFFVLVLAVHVVRVLVVLVPALVFILVLILVFVPVLNPNIVLVLVLVLVFSAYICGITTLGLTFRRGPTCTLGIYDGNRCTSIDH